MLSNSTYGYTRLDLKTHHIVSYQKPVIIVDDFLKTTLKYDFGTQLLAGVHSYKHSFSSLLFAFKTPFQPLVDAYISLFKYMDISVTSYRSSDFMYSNSSCIISQAPYAGSKPLGEFLKQVTEYPALREYWTNYLPDVKFYTRAHFWAYFCPTDLALAMMYLPNYNATHYSESERLCKAMNNKMQIRPTENTVNHAHCNTPVFQYAETDNTTRRNKRWDSSYVCGWPIVSSTAKFLGGECTTNIDVESLKQNLASIQKFSDSNTHLIGALQHQLSIVNARTNMHYEQLQNLVNDINEQHEAFSTDMERLMHRVNDLELNTDSRILINSLTISYGNYLFRIYQTIVDYRFTYIETLNSIQQHYHYPTEHMQHVDPELTRALNKHGLEIPKYGSKVPYVYSKIRYNKVIGINFFDLEFDVYIPIKRLDKIEHETYQFSQLSPLPLGIDRDNVIYNTYQGPAICSDTICYRTPVQGFCKESENYWFCGSDYFSTLNPITNTYTNHATKHLDAIIVPPNTVYFVHNTSYALNGQQFKAFAGSVLLLNCKSKFVTFGGVKLNTADYVECNEISQANVFIHGTILNDTQPPQYIELSNIIELEKIYQKTIYPTIQLLSSNKTLSIDTKPDDTLRQEYDALKITITEKLSSLDADNEHILNMISMMKAKEYDTPIWFYLIIGTLIVFTLRLFRIL